MHRVLECRAVFIFLFRNALAFTAVTTYPKMRTGMTNSVHGVAKVEICLFATVTVDFADSVFNEIWVEPK